MKPIYKIGLLATFTFFSACQKQENYPLGPVITYKEFAINSSDGSATLQISFTDGYGTIGYQGEQSPPPNFYIELLRDSAGHFVPVFTSNTDPVLGDTLGIPYNVPYVTQSGREKGLSGQIQVALVAKGQGIWYIYPDSTYEYRMWLIDAGKHISNRVTTPPIVAPNN